MVLFHYRSEATIQLQMTYTTKFALQFQGARFIHKYLAHKTAHDTQEFHLHCHSFPHGLHMHSRWQLKHKTHKCQVAYNKNKLPHVHSPLLRESFSVSTPSLTYMLKFSESAGLHHYPWKNRMQTCRYMKGKRTHHHYIVSTHQLFQIDDCIVHH